jgi:NAD(P)H-nitrite reductase large subunit
VTHCLEFGEIGDEELSCAYRPDFLPDPSLTDPSHVVRPRVRDARGAISRLLIVGTGIAGLSAAAAARARDPFIEIELVGEEPHLPYGRPLISKSAFGGAGPRRFPLHPMEWYEKRRIGIKTGARVAGLNAVTGEAVTNRGERIPFDRCIIATGAESFVPPIEGREADGVSVVRDAFSLSRLRQSLPAAHRAVVIGGGVIGIEVAWELYRADREIAVLELAPSLMGRLLDTDSARGLARNMERMGVRVRTGICISGIEHSGGRVTGVRTDDGNLYEADIVVISCGIAPHKELAAEAGCATERGIVVNERMETDVPNIYACGDCAQFDGVNKGLWTEAAAQGSVAGANAAGAASAYGPEDGAVLLNCFGTCLYAIGETAGADGTEVLSFTNRSPRASRFLVNEMHSLGEVTERYVFRDERLAGGVLTGDLSRMETLRACVSVREPRDAFIRKMEES